MYEAIGIGEVSKLCQCLRAGDPCRLNCTLDLPVLDSTIFIVYNYSWEMFKVEGLGLSLKYFVKGYSLFAA